jgi:hypothetical protein
MKSYSNTAELIESLEDEIQAISEEIATLKKKPNSFNERILFKYIDTGSTGKAKEFVRAQGVMSDRGSLFSSGDVSRLIKDGAGDVSPALLAIARKVVHMKKKSGSNR